MPAVAAAGRVRLGVPNAFLMLEARSVAGDDSLIRGS
jgi:hypothetical protein